MCSSDLASAAPRLIAAALLCHAAALATLLLAAALTGAWPGQARTTSPSWPTDTETSP